MTKPMTPEEVQEFIASRAKGKDRANTQNVIEAERSAIETMLAADIPASDIAKLMSARYGGDPTVGALQVAMSRLGLKRASKPGLVARTASAPSAPTTSSELGPRELADPRASPKGGIVPPRGNRNTFE